MPATVDKIVDAIKREHPDYSEEKTWAIAYSTYNKMGKGKSKASYCDGCDNPSSDCVCESGCHCCAGCRSNVNEAEEKDIEDMDIDIESNKKQTRAWSPDNSCGNIPQEGPWKRVYNKDGHPAPKCIKVEKKPTAKSKATRGRPHFTRKANQCVQMEGISGNDFGLGYKDEIIAFLTKNTEPTFNDVLELAESLGCDHESLHREIYKMLSDYVFHEGTGQIDSTTNLVGPKHELDNETQNKQVTPNRDLYEPSPINMGIYSYLLGQ